MSDDTVTDSLRRASLARMKHAIAEAQQLVVILDKIKNGNAPIQEMANARGTVAKLCQSVHEASIVDPENWTTS